MYRKEVNFKSFIFKIFIIYFSVYLSAIFLRFNYDFKSLFINIEYKFLVLINIFFISFGLPLSIVLDFILIKVFGLFYILIFSPVQTFISLMQVIFLRKINLNLYKKNFLMKNIKTKKIHKTFENITIKPIYIFLIRAFPILPFLLGSYFIAASPNNKKIIFLFSLLGAYFYYLSLFVIIIKA
tara:strand:+ start:18 stop:566 length:549 start_codon:yes stop_codon:yes gene_type:complete